MDIKIPNRSLLPLGAADETAAIEATTTSVHAGCDASAVTPATVSADALAQVTAELRTGVIDSSEAIERLVTLTLGDPALVAAPAHVKAETGDALRAMLETDPRLAALLARLAARPQQDE